MGPLSVLTGGLLWVLAAVLPVVGWAGALLCLFASLGAAAQVLLQPRAFDVVEARAEDLEPAEGYGVAVENDGPEDGMAEPGEDEDRAGSGAVGAP